jgi:hypothetical protein
MRAFFRESDLWENCALIQDVEMTFMRHLVLSRGHKSKAPSLWSQIPLQGWESCGFVNSSPRERSFQ